MGRSGAKCGIICPLLYYEPWATCMEGGCQLCLFTVCPLRCLLVMHCLSMCCALFCPWFVLSIVLSVVRANRSCIVLSVVCPRQSVVRCFVHTCIAYLLSSCIVLSTGLSIVSVHGLSIVLFKGELVSCKRNHNGYTERDRALFCPHVHYFI